MWRVRIYKWKEVYYSYKQTQRRTHTQRCNIKTKIKKI